MADVLVHFETLEKQFTFFGFISGPQKRVHLSLCFKRPKAQSNDKWLEFISLSGSGTFVELKRAKHPTSGGIHGKCKLCIFAKECFFQAAFGHSSQSRGNLLCTGYPGNLASHSKATTLIYVSESGRPPLRRHILLRKAGRGKHQRPHLPQELSNARSPSPFKKQQLLMV